MELVTMKYWVSSLSCFCTKILFFSDTIRYRTVFLARKKVVQEENDGISNTETSQEDSKCQGKNDSFLDPINAVADIDNFSIGEGLEVDII